MKREMTLIIALSLTAIFVRPAGTENAFSGETPDDTPYALLLKKYVSEERVNYKGFKAEEEKLDLYLKNLEMVNPEKLEKNEQLAFYINAYNAWTIKLVLSGYPGIKSIKDLGSIFKSPWKKKICRINKELISLDHIEHKILRPRFREPKVHFAINCASISCPPLLSRPFNGKEIQSQLSRLTQKFINNPERNRLEGNKLYVSKIFKWFSEDFNNDIPGFFLKYAHGDFKEKLQKRSENIKIIYLRYDWSLNEQ